MRINMTVGITTTGPPVARPVTNQDERRAILATLKESSQYWDKHMDAIEDWVQGSCLVEVILSTSPG